MVGRPPLEVGTYGKITVFAEGVRYRAHAKFRDYDGETRRVARFGDSEAKAERALKAALRDRQGKAHLTTTSRVRDLADDWLTNIDASDLAINTKRLYRLSVDKHIRPALGGLRLNEMTPGSVDRALLAINLNHGPGAAKTARTVLAGMMSLGVRQDALTLNPVRDTTPISRKTQKTPRALTQAEEDDLCDKLRTDQRAVDLDLPDLVEFMLMTGARIGEASACRYPVLELDLAETWEVNATIVRIKGEGLHIQPRTKSDAGWRVLALPPTAVAMIRRRETELRRRPPDGVIFGSPAGHLRDPSNTQGDLKETLMRLNFDWVTSHTFRKTVATKLDKAGLTARQIADQLGHSKPSMTLDKYMGRNVVTSEAARLLDR